MGDHCPASDILQHFFIFLMQRIIWRLSPVPVLILLSTSKACYPPVTITNRLDGPVRIVITWLPGTEGPCCHPIVSAACEKTSHNSEPASWDAPTTEGEMRAGQTWTRKTEMLY